MRARFGGDLFPELEEGGELGFEPLCVAGLGCECVAGDYAAENVQAGLDSCDVCVCECTLGFLNYVVPRWGCDDDFGDQTVEVRPYHCCLRWEEVGVYSDTVSGWEAEGLDLANAE